MSVIAPLLKLNNTLLDLSTPIVMGVINATPDSFFTKTTYNSNKKILLNIEQMITQGASIIDVGGYSTRPQADNVTQEEEIKRVSTVIELIRTHFPTVFISVDTFRAAVARHVVANFDVAMINDISGGSLDAHMFETIADLKVAYVLMHTRGTPQTMHLHTDYTHVVSEVIQFLEKRLAQLHLLGVTDVVVDPGFGFAKTLDQNYELLNKLSYFQVLNVPLLAGLSRKSMLYKLLDITADEALNATTAANMFALIGGASILRVHDVKEAQQAIAIFEKYKKAE